MGLFDSVIKEYAETEKTAKTGNIKQEVAQLAKYVGVPVQWFERLIKHESGNNPKAINPTSKAVGLIQFLPSTLKGYGHTSETYLDLSISEQFKLIRKYYAPVVGKIKKETDLYLYNFFPRAVLDGWGDARIIESDTLGAAKIAKQNVGFDLNNNKQITVGEFRKYWDKNIKTEKKTNIIVVLLLLVVGYFVMKGSKH